MERIGRAISSDNSNDSSDDDDDAVEGTEEAKGDDKKSKPTRKVSNPVEDEISALLGE